MDKKDEFFEALFHGKCKKRSVITMHETVTSYKLSNSSNLSNNGTIGRFGTYIAFR